MAKLVAKPSKAKLKSSGYTLDYDNLSNKPSINNVELSGDKSSDDLGLQKKLTAGQNIILESDGTISASGGVTSYNDLTNKPKIDGVDISNIWVATGLKYTSNGNYLSANGELLFNRMYPVTNDILNLLPLFAFQDSYHQHSFLPSNDSGVIFQLGNRNVINNPNYEDHREKYYMFFPSVGNSIYLKTDTESFVDGIDSGVVEGAWRKIGESVKVTSAAVNQNGTITFTNSDGSTFTTTGTSVIGPQGSDYVLTSQDKSDIANIVLSELPTTQGVLYGN